jgi:hypothetical protein
MVYVLSVTSASSKKSVKKQEKNPHHLPNGMPVCDREYLFIQLPHFIDLVEIYNRIPARRSFLLAAQFPPLFFPSH